MNTLSNYGQLIAELLFTSVLAICFIQSGLDKITDRKGNLDWLKGHFSKTPFKSMVPFLVSLLTLLEVTGGLLCAVGVVQLIFSGNIQWAFYGTVVCSAAMVSLFLGQRIARDYAGAASLIPYTILAGLNLLLFSWQGH